MLLIGTEMNLLLSIQVQEILNGHYMQKYLRKKFDKDGKIASKGTVKLNIINEFERDKYFKKNFPKSLGCELF